MKSTKEIVDLLRNTSQPLSAKMIRLVADRLERLDGICTRFMDERETMLGGHDEI